MKVNPFFGAFLLSAMMLATSCKKEAKDEPVKEDLSSEAPAAALAKNGGTDLLKSVRNATSRFHSTTQAIKAGYLPSNHCVSDPVEGGMGYHWVNPSLIDDVFDPLKPEAVLYAKGPGGNLRLIAVEYIVMNNQQPAPMFGTQAFDVNGAPIQDPHWTLHVWLYENNPSGMFKPFNPNITCP